MGLENMISHALVEHDSNLNLKDPEFFVQIGSIQDVTIKRLYNFQPAGANTTLSSDCNVDICSLKLDTSFISNKEISNHVFDNWEKQEQAKFEQLMVSKLENYFDYTNSSDLIGFAVENVEGTMSLSTGEMNESEIEMFVWIALVVAIALAGIGSVIGTAMYYRAKIKGLEAEEDTSSELARSV